MPLLKLLLWNPHETWHPRSRLQIQAFQTTTSGWCGPWGPFLMIQSYSCWAEKANPNRHWLAASGLWGRISGQNKVCRAEGSKTGFPYKWEETSRHMTVCPGAGWWVGCPDFNKDESQTGELGAFGLIPGVPLAGWEIVTNTFGVPCYVSSAHF